MSKRAVAILLLATLASASVARAQASRDSLELIVDALSVDPVTGEPRSRFALRESDLSPVIDMLAQRLARNAGAPVERRPFVIEDDRYDTGPVNAWNLVACIEGTAGGDDALLVTAHYDAIGARDDGWFDGWRTMAAPGADDNASGVAAALEIARALRDAPPPFDVEFVFFSGEELGRLGSIEYNDECDPVCAGRILGVVNLDMIGWHDAGVDRGTSIMADALSAWLAFLVSAAVREHAPGLDIDIIVPGPSNWDHASFWTHTWLGELRHIPAVTLAEPLNERGSILYPYYHSAADTIEWIDFEQAGLITDAVTAFVAGFDDADPLMAIMPADIVMRAGNGLWGETRFSAGEEILLRVNPRNVGGMPDGGSFSISVVLENVSGSRRLHEGTYEVPDPLRTTTVDIPLTLSPSEGGENRVHASIVSSGVDVMAGSDRSRLDFTVGGVVASPLVSHSFQPNPMTGSAGESRFCVNLAGEANMVVEILTISGERVAVGYIGDGYGRPVAPGLNCFGCDELFSGLEELAAGVYVYRIALFPSEGPMERTTGRFAVVR